MWGALAPSGDDSAVMRAQEIMYDAVGQTDPKKRAKLAKQALTVSADCADAYVLLAEQAKGRQDALDLYVQGVAAGERAIGPETFRDDAGHFWGLLETRPYMRARSGLAMTLWSLGRREEAADHLRDMLRLNPGDNQGLRYTLAAWLVNLDRDEELAKLLKQFDEVSAMWAFTKALLAFRLSGDTPASRKILQAAHQTNEHIQDYLTGDKIIPTQPPGYYSPGETSEAAIYAIEHLSAWKSTPGAVTWVKSTLGENGPKFKEPEWTAAPDDRVKGRLAKVRQQPDVWQLDSRLLPKLMSDDGTLVQPYFHIVGNRSKGLVLAQDMGLEPPTAGMLWDLVARAIQKPSAGKPHRPSVLEMPLGSDWDELQHHLEEIGIECVRADELDFINALFADLTEHLDQAKEPSLLDIPGVTPDRAGQFYEAAAEFYRAAPWKSAPSDNPIRVDGPAVEGGPWYAVVMGQMGMTLGLALYNDIRLLKRLLTGRMGDKKSALETEAMSLTFDPERDTSEADLLAIREHGWAIAGPEAYPTFFFKERGMSMRPLTLSEIDLLEACLRAIPAFMAARKPGDASAWTVDLDGSPLRLAWDGGS